MQDFSTKVDSVDNLTAAEFNNLAVEAETVVTSAGLTLSGASTQQLSEAIAIYAAAGEFYQDGGSANTYTLSALGSRKAPTSYLDGMRVRFYAGNTNTGAPTVNVGGLGAKDIKTPAGAALTGSEINSGNLIELVYKASAGYFTMEQVVSVAGTQTITGQKTFTLVPKSSADPSASTDLVRLSYLQTYVDENAVPLGTILPFSAASGSVPTGYLLCGGQAVSRATYSDLFTLISSTYGGGDGSTTFNLPDLRGRAPFGKDDMGGSAASRITGGGTLAATGGAQTHTLTVSEMPAHGHPFLKSNGVGDSVYTDGFVSDAPGGATVNVVYPAFSGTPTGTAGEQIGGTGGGSAHNNLPPYLITNYIIRY